MVAARVEVDMYMMDIVERRSREWCMVVLVVRGAGEIWGAEFVGW